jgi:hypothetical protein
VAEIDARAIALKNFSASDLGKAKRGCLAQIFQRKLAIDEMNVCQFGRRKVAVYELALIKGALPQKRARPRTP